MDILECRERVPVIVAKRYQSDADVLQRTAGVSHRCRCLARRRSTKPIDVDSLTSSRRRHPHWHARRRITSPTRKRARMTPFTRSLSLAAEWARRKRRLCAVVTYRAGATSSTHRRSGRSGQADHVSTVPRVTGPTWTTVSSRPAQGVDFREVGLRPTEALHLHSTDAGSSWRARRQSAEVLADIFQENGSRPGASELLVDKSG